MDRPPARPLVRDRARVHDEFFDRRPFPCPRRDLEFVGQGFDEHDRPLDPRHARVRAAALPAAR